jgi:CheY-like chemotaxis protein
MPKRLLVVDDDVRLTRLVALTAAQLAIVTRQINDPSQALETFMEFKPDFVLLDVFMPEVDGIDVLHEILLTAIPTHVVLTSGAGEELLDLAREAMRFHGAGEAIVLAKPFRRAELVEVLTRLMD